jgi:hypothetical protein
MKILALILGSLLCIAGCKLGKTHIQKEPRETLIQEDQETLTREEVLELIHQIHFKSHSSTAPINDCKWCIEEKWVLDFPENNN